MDFQKVAKFFDKNMMYLIALSILSGAAVGWFAPEFSKGLKSYINLTLFLMIFPMLVGIKMEEMFKAFRNLRPISLAIGLASQFFSPLTVVMLAINPLIQMPVMAWILRWAPRVFQREKDLQRRSCKCIQRITVPAH